MVYLQLAAGLLLLFAGGELLVRGAVGIARRLAVSPLLIGLTVVGFGTSMPELATSIRAALAGAPGIAVGNVVGSNIANVLLILGATALVTPLFCTRQAFRRDGTMLIMTTVLVVVVCLVGSLSRLAGVGFLSLLTLYIVYSYLTERRHPDAGAALYSAEATAIMPVTGPLWRAVTLTLAGLGGVLFGATLLVDSAISLSVELGLSDTVIGLTVVAVGTSLPELASSLAAAIRRQADLAFGNIIGSNIFNLLGILGATALVTPIEVPGQVLALDLWVMLAATVLLLVAAFTGWRIVRIEGLGFLALYAGYLVVLFHPGLRSLLGLA